MFTQRGGSTKREKFRRMATIRHNLFLAVVRAERTWSSVQTKPLALVARLTQRNVLHISGYIDGRATIGPRIARLHSFRNVSLI